MKCNLCSKKNFETILVFDQEKIKVVRCKNCKLICLDPIQKPPKVQDEYVELKVDKFFTYINKVREIQFIRDLEIIHQFVPKGKLLDVGSSYGYFLNMAQKKGYETVGIEPSKSVIKFSKKLFPKLQVLHEEFEHTKIRKKSMNVVTIWSVLEHTVAPSDVLRKANEVLKKDGVVCIRVPDADGALVKLIWFLHNTLGMDNPSKSMYLINYIYKHFYHFTHDTLRKLLEKNGFEVTHFYRENSLNPNLLKERAFATPEKKEIAFLQNPVIRTGLKYFLHFCDAIGSQDEIVMFGRKTTELKK